MQCSDIILSLILVSALIKHSLVIQEELELCQLVSMELYKTQGCLTYTD